MIGIGVVGFGYWGPNLARAISEADSSSLIAIADLSSSARSRAQLRHPAARVVDDWRVFLDDPAIDAFAVATPTKHHFEIALAALQAGKHVLIEKPMAPTSQQARILVELAAKRGLVLMVDHTFVYTSAVQKIRELVATGVVGNIYYYDSTRINLGLFQQDVNVIWDLAVHDMAIMDFALRMKPIAVSCTGAGHIAGNPENMAHITLYLEGGATAHLNVNWLAPVKIRRTLIGGSRRMIVYDDLEPSEKVKVYDRGVDLEASAGLIGGREQIHTLLPNYRMGDIWTPQLAVKEALVVEVEHFAKCVADGEKPLTDGASGLRIVSLLEGATQSLRQRGRPVELADLRQAS